MEGDVIYTRRGQTANGCLWFLSDSFFEIILKRIEVRNVLGLIEAR